MIEPEMQLNAIRNYITEFLADPWDYSEGGKMWCAGYRTALQKILDISNQKSNGLKLWGTEVLAIDPINPERGIINYGGPNIIAPSKSLAQEYCLTHGDYGYLRVMDELIAEIPCKPGTL